MPSLLRIKTPRNPRKTWIVAVLRIQRVTRALKASWRNHGSLTIDLSPVACPAFLNPNSLLWSAEVGGNTRPTRCAFAPVPGENGAGIA